MKRTIALIAAAIAVGAWAACTFPSVTYSDAKDGGPDGTTDDGGSDGEVDAMEEPPPPDFPDASPDVFNPCDQDKDGYKAVGCTGGKDCNDFDNRANPGQQNFLTDPPDGAPNGDWNCNQAVEPQYPTVSCGGFLNALACTGAGFAANPGCGKSAAYVTCTWNGLKLTCEAIDSGLRTQGCR